MQISEGGYYVLLDDTTLTTD